MDRDMSEEAKQVRSRLRWVAPLPPGAMVMFGPGLLLGPISEFMALM